MHAAIAVHIVCVTTCLRDTESLQKKTVRHSGFSLSVNSLQTSMNDSPCDVLVTCIVHAYDSRGIIKGYGEDDKSVRLDGLLVFDFKKSAQSVSFFPLLGC